MNRQRAPRYYVLSLGFCLLACSQDVSGLVSGADRIARGGSEQNAGAGADADPVSVGGSGGDGGDNHAGGSSAGMAAGGSVNHAAGSGGVAAGAPTTAGAPSMLGGSGGATAMCVAQGAEKCNERDDDCDGVVDNGCPGPLLALKTTENMLLGDSPGGEVARESCAEGQVLVGIDAAFGSWLEQLRGQCATLRIVPPLGKEEASLAVGDALPLAPHPEQAGSEVTSLACDAGRVLVGIRIGERRADVADTTKTVITQLALDCAKPLLTKSKDGYVVSWHDGEEVGPVKGSYSNGSDWFATDLLPESELAVRLIIASGSWVDRVGLGSAPVQAGTR